MGFETFLFVALGLIAIVAAAGMIYSKNAVHSALFLIVNFGCVALLYLMLEAPFLSMVQIAVYAGAIMVLFLFVIMLLGAEQTSDTSARKFSWLTGVATALTISFLGIFAVVFFLNNGLDFPEYAGDTPQVRVIHSASVVRAVDLEVSGGELEAPITYTGLEFGAVTDFMSLPVGDYTVALKIGPSAIAQAQLSLKGGDVLSLVALGTFSTEVQALQIAVVPQSYTDSGAENGRLLVVNAANNEDLLLVDEGPNRTFDELNGQIRDRILVDGLGLGEVSAPIRYRDSNDTPYNLSFYALRDGDYTKVAELDEYTVSTGSEQLLILTPDYAGIPDVDGNYRLRVLYSTEGSLNINTAESFGSPKDIGQQLFTTYLLPVNLVGFLLLVALVGVIVLTRPQGITTESRATRNRRRKVSRPLANVISQQTGTDLSQSAPKLEEPSSAGD